MRSRVIALALCATVVMAVPAGASEHTFAGTAEATALKLTITPPGEEPQGLTFGASTATVQSSPSEACDGVACATGAAAVEPLGETAQVAITTGQEEETAQAFTVPPELEPLLSGALGTGTAAADAEAPSATGSATAGELQVHVAQTLVGPIRDELGPQLDEVTNEISDSLQPVLEPLEDAPTADLVSGVRTLLEDLLNGLADLPIASVEIGQSTATAADSPKGDPGVTTATATAQGAAIELIPTPTVAPEGLFQIEVGDATASAQTDGTTGTTSSKGSVVKLRIRDPRVVDPSAEDAYQTVDVATDRPEECFGQSPLLMCIIIGGTAESGEGPEAGAVAAGVRIRVLADAEPDDAAADQNPLPGLTLAVAEAIAGVNAQLPEAPQPQPAPDEPEEQPVLPSTGGGLGALGAAILAAGGLLSLRLRRRA